MRLTLLYFAHIRQAVSTPGESLEVPPNTTITMLSDILAQSRPALQPHLRTALFSRNEAWAPRSTVLSDGDRVGIMPPVSGG